MQNIPLPIQQFLTHVNTPGVMLHSPAFRIMGSLRRKLAKEDDETWQDPSAGKPSNYQLTAAQIDEAASSLNVEIKVDLTDEEVEYLAEMAFQTYCTFRASFAAWGFHNPALMAAKKLADFSLSG